MKHTMMFLVMSLALVSLAATNIVTIYDIQYTSNPGCEGTYPSPYCGLTIRTSGIVTAIHPESGIMYMSGLHGGEWNAICVKAGRHIHQNRLRPGVRVDLTGMVVEQFGMTMLSDVSNIVTNGVQTTLPEVLATTGLVRVNESYESALVRLQNVSLINHAGAIWEIDDGSGACVMEDGFDVLSAQRVNFDEDGIWQEARGIVSFRFGEFRLNPRTPLDLGGQYGLNVNQTSWGRIKSLYK
ncbi:MAG: hypothetical protein K8R90_10425 [Candidatus Cloacimonetes bacterium]|nr:hypothetical protein [Candidatus Cloacimonadota bacterium]